jgi:hypothetical protein
MGSKQMKGEQQALFLKKRRKEESTVYLHRIKEIYAKKT